MSRTRTIRLTDELDRSLVKACKQQKRPVSDVMREAVSRYLFQIELERIRERVRPFAEARGILTDEDVFKVVS